MKARAAHCSAMLFWALGRSTGNLDARVRRMDLGVDSKSEAVGMTRRDRPRGASPMRAATAAVEESIRAAALALFVERGFHGTSMRDIASRAGTTVSHLYYFFPSKDDVLRSMMLRIVDDLLLSLESAAAAYVDAPVDRLGALVQAHVLFHSQRQAEAFIGGSEVRSLTEKDRPEILERYHRVSAIFRKSIADGTRRGVFVCPHGALVTSAIITMCTGVSSWYQKDRGLSPQALARHYAELALRMVGAPST